jgi:hypothetical protein
MNQKTLRLGRLAGLTASPNQGNLSEGRAL